MSPGGKKRKHDGAEESTSEKQELIVEPHTIPNRGPYPYNQPKKNSIPFTPTQTEAIKAGMQPGLTMVRSQSKHPMEETHCKMVVPNFHKS